MTHRPHSLKNATALVVGSLLLGLGPAGSATGATVPDPTRSTRPGVYLVTLSAAPAGAYRGGVRGLSATRPLHGARFDRARAAVAAYSQWLVARQDALLGRVGDPAVLYRYTTAVNGFAATLTGEQVRQLRAAPGVLRVERSTTQHIDRTRAAAALGSSLDMPGLTGLRDAWARHGGPSRAGQGVVVGVVDSGIWPENPSFSGLADRTPVTAKGLRGFHGGCEAAEEWDADQCTDKIVSARWFVNGFGARNVAVADYLSPRDGTGHGSHVTSTAAGDHAVRVQVDGQRFGTISGIAPAARVAVYKACWIAPDPADDGCTTADTVAAVDRAVADGVDVLNYSVSGSRIRDDSVERAFLGAASAGVFVAASAGNGGRAGSVAHVSPWVTTVAASTHHDFSGVVRLGDETTFVGAMVATRPVRPTGLVLGGAIPGERASVTAARQCSTGALDAGKAQGRIVVCDRGGGARVDKSASVARAGGVGMVLANTRTQRLDADVHALPTVHLDAREAAAVKTYVRRAGGQATASLVPRGHGTRRVPALAGFSARGPAEASGGDVLKPDLTAPGDSVLGAVAPPSDSGRSWDLVSGTSTSVPHVAGLAAFLAGVRPGWSPARVKSALMTTATDLVGRGAPLVTGAGHVDPTRLLDPGLVFDTGPEAWQRVAAGGPARQVNAASVAVGSLDGPTTVTRRITNVGSRRESYSARVQGMPGVDVQAFPATVRLAPGQSRTVRLRIIARPSAKVDHDVTGWLVWRGDRHRVRLPVSVRPTVVTAPAEVDGTADRGRVVVRGRSGNGRTVKLRSSGLVPARTTPVEVAPGRFDPRRPRADADTELRRVRVPAGTDVARFAVAVPAGNLDMYVFRDGRLVDSAAEASPGAALTLTKPAAGDYQVYVNARSTADGRPSSGRLETWVVPDRGGSEVALSTDAVGFAPGRRFRYAASWKDLDRDKHYLGVVAYGDSGRRTLVDVNPR